MDLNLNLSPSKARQLNAQAQQVNALTRWLENLCLSHSSDNSNSDSNNHQNSSVIASTSHSPPSLPPHLLTWREEITSQPSGTQILETLQSFRAANLRANELRSLSFEACKEELEILRREHESRRSSQARSVLDQLLAALSPEARVAVQRLARAGVVLDLKLDRDVDGQGEEEEDLQTRFMRAVIEQCSRMTEIQRQIRAVEELQRQIQTQTERTRHSKNRDIEGETSNNHLTIINSLTSANNSTTTKNSTTNTPKNTAVKIEDDEAGEISDNPIFQIRNEFEHRDKTSLLDEQTATLNRETKHITRKKAEYTDRIQALTRQLAKLEKSVSSSSSSSNSNSNSTSQNPDQLAIATSIQNRSTPYTLEQQFETQLSQIRILAIAVAARKSRVEELQDTIRGFEGLPPDLVRARTEVRRVQGLLEQLRGKREELFEMLSRG